jgi:hypothetical protein
MITLLTILACLIFVGGAYFMGNFVSDTFKDDIQERVISTLYGVLLWGGIGIIGVICYLIYLGISYLLK